MAGLSEQQEKSKRAAVSKQGLRVNGYFIPWSVLVLAVTLVLAGDRGIRRLDHIEAQAKVNAERLRELEQKVQRLESRGDTTPYWRGSQ